MPRWVDKKVAASLEAGETLRAVSGVMGKPGWVASARKAGHFDTNYSQREPGGVYSGFTGAPIDDVDPEQQVELTDTPNPSLFMVLTDRRVLVFESRFFRRLEMIAAFELATLKVRVIDRHKTRLVEVRHDDGRWFALESSALRNPSDDDPFCRQLRETTRPLHS